MRPLFLTPWILGAALCAGAAQADDDSFQGSSTLLELGHYRMRFTYPDGPHEGHVGRFGIGYSEPMSDEVSLFLHGGYATLDVDNDPVATGQDYTGRYLGVGVRYETESGDYLNLYGETSYTWAGVDGAVPDQQSHINWYESYLAFGPVLRLDGWRVYAGAYGQRVDGDETDTGAVNQQRNLGVDRGAGAYLGIVWYVDRSGSVGIYATSGARQGIRLVFRREF